MKHADFDPLSGEFGPELRDENVVVMQESDGDFTMVPDSVRRRGPDARRAVTDTLRAAKEVHEAQARLADHVAELRDLGLSWSVVGWCTGMTGEGARTRWGSED